MRNCVVASTTLISIPSVSCHLHTQFHHCTRVFIHCILVLQHSITSLHTRFHTTRILSYTTLNYIYYVTCHLALALCVLRPLPVLYIPSKYRFPTSVAIAVSTYHAITPSYTIHTILLQHTHHPPPITLFKSVILTVIACSD
jgi:hypothetical protein